jgi:hypothetical protein
MQTARGTPIALSHLQQEPHASTGPSATARTRANRIRVESRMNEAERTEDKGQSLPISDEELARKKAVLGRARADHAIKGEPTTGMPDDMEHCRANDVTKSV